MWTIRRSLIGASPPPVLDFYIKLGAVSHVKALFEPDEDRISR